MNEYIATFFSHFGAIRFGRSLGEEGVACAMMPVPRSISSSCGTSVRFSCEGDPSRFANDDVEQILISDGAGWKTVYDNQ